MIKIESYSYVFLSLWIIFICYYGDIFNKLKSLPYSILALIGGAGGTLAYWSAYKLNAVIITNDNELYYLLFVFIFWLIFFPLSILLFYEEKYWDFLLDKEICIMEDQIKNLLSNLNSLFVIQSAERKQIAKELQESVILILKNLGMANAIFLVQFEEIKPTAEGINNINRIFLVSQQKTIINYEKSQPSSIDNPVVDPYFNVMRSKDTGNSTATYIVIGLLIAATIIPLATWWYFSK